TALPRLTGLSRRQRCSETSTGKASASRVTSRKPLAGGKRRRRSVRRRECIHLLESRRPALHRIFGAHWSFIAKPHKKPTPNRYSASVKCTRKESRWHAIQCWPMPGSKWPPTSAFERHRQLLQSLKQS